MNNLPPIDPVVHLGVWLQFSICMMSRFLTDENFIPTYEDVILTPDYVSYSDFTKRLLL